MELPVKEVFRPFTMHKTRSSIWLSLLLVASCSPACSADLTRAQAKILLSKTAPFTSMYNRLFFADNTELAFIASGGSNNPEFAKVIVADPNIRMLTLILRTPVPARVDEVTGISSVGMQGMKEVLFRWSFVNIPNVLRPYVVGGGTGRAIIRLFDDGWRVGSQPELSY